MSRRRESFLMLRRSAVDELAAMDPGEALLLLLLLAMANHRDGTAVVTTAELAEATGCAPSTTKRRLRRLEAAGELSWQRGANRDAPSRVQISRYFDFVLTRAAGHQRPAGRFQRATSGPPAARYTAAEVQKQAVKTSTLHPHSINPSAPASLRDDRGEPVGGSESARNYRSVATAPAPGSADPLGDDDWEGRRARMLAEMKRRYGELLGGGGR